MAKGAGNRSLIDARAGKNDEFYTQLSDIERELWHYRDFFRGKTVLCNCDDPFESNFFKYFALNFDALGLKKLITTCFASSPVMYREFTLFGENSEPTYRPEDRKPYYIELTEVRDLNGDGAVDLDDVCRMLQMARHEYTPKMLKGDGDFRSAECLRFLREADVIVTNPPFSMFREYLELLIRYKKKFIIVGNQNNITYKEVFPLIQNNEIWTGATYGDMSFTVPDYYEPRATRYWVDENGQKWRSMGNICWFTNIDIPRRHEPLILSVRFNPDIHKKYDNYDAINIDKVSDIPCDYFGVMGVPLTFLYKHNPEQFEIIGIERYTVPKECLVGGRLAINGKPTYARILIRRIDK